MSYPETQAHKTELIEITFTAILSVSPDRNWRVGHQPRTLAELFHEVALRRLHGEEITQRVTSRMAEEGRIALKPSQLPLRQEPDRSILTAGDRQLIAEAEQLGREHHD